MPWKTNGTFERVNPDYSASADGSLWQKDLESNPSIKIVASRHDWHDQDLGQGIQECINISGYNQMNAQLKMGGNAIVNVGAPVQSGDAAIWNNLVKSMTYESTILRLFDNDDNEIDNVQISGGGTGGSVLSVSGVSGETVTFEGVTENPITVNGSVGLADIPDLTPNVYASPSSVTVDSKGRVTAIVAGVNTGQPDQTLGKIQDSDTGVTMTLSKQSGSDAVVISAATETIAGVMTAAQVTALNELIAAGAVGMQPPIEINGVDTDLKNNLLVSLYPWLIKGTASLNNPNIWESVYTITGAGIMEFLGIEEGTLATLDTIDVRILIDGVNVFEQLQAFDEPVSASGDAFTIIGFTDGVSTEPVLQQVAFSQSFVIQMRCDQLNNSTMNMYLKWQQISN